MPLYNWIKCNDGDFRFTRKKPRLSIEANEKDGKSWVIVYDEYIKEFDLSPIYKKLLKTMKKKALLQLKFIETWERFKLTEIDIETEKLKNMLANNGDGMTIEQSLIHLSKWLGYRLNPKEITVIEYFNILRQYGQNNKR